MKRGFRSIILINNYTTKLNLLQKIVITKENEVALIEKKINMPYKNKNKSLVYVTIYYY